MVFLNHSSYVLLTNSSIIVPRSKDFKKNQSASGFLVTVIKSDPRKTPSTPSMAKRRLEKGDVSHDDPAANDMGDRSPITERPGINFKHSGFGVSSV